MISHGHALIYTLINIRFFVEIILTESYLRKTRWNIQLWKTIFLVLFTASLIFKTILQPCLIKDLMSSLQVKYLLELYPKKKNFVCS